MAVDGPNKIIILNLSSVSLASNRIVKKIWKQRQKGKKKKSAQWLKKAGFLKTDNLQIIDSNDDLPLDDL